MFKTLRNVFLLAAGIYIALRWLRRSNARAIARTAAANQAIPPAAPAPAPEPVATPVPAAPEPAAEVAAVPASPSVPLAAPVMVAPEVEPEPVAMPVTAGAEVAATTVAPVARGNVAPRDHASVFDAHICSAPAIEPVLDGPVDDAPARAVLEQLTAALREVGDGTWMVGDDAADEPDVDAPSAATPAQTPAPAPDGAVSGTFVVSGIASGPRQVMMGVVAFPRTLALAPTDWQRGGAAPSGVLVLDVDNTANCDPETVGVVFVNGYAPSTDGFTVRVVSAAAGPFTAGGRFTFADG